MKKGSRLFIVARLDGRREWWNDHTGRWSGAGLDAERAIVGSHATLTDTNDGVVKMSQRAKREAFKERVLNGNHIGQVRFVIVEIVKSFHVE